MKRIVAAIALLVLSAGIPSYAQTILTNTTLSAALSAGANGQVAIVASATGITAPVAGDPTKTTFLAIDAELAQVVGVSGTQITLARGVAGTQARPHASGAVALVIPAYLATYFTAPIPTGSCTRVNQPALPVVSVSSAGAMTLSDCVGGQWVNGSASQTTVSQPLTVTSPGVGSVLLTALETAGTAPAANTDTFCTEVELQNSMLVTGIGLLNGTTVGTDKHLVILYDSTGNPLASSAVAGTLSATASVYQHFAFTAKYYAVGPARYFACYQSNGVTDTLRHPITSVNDQLISGTITGQTFGTIPVITVPTTFTTATGPYVELY